MKMQRKNALGVQQQPEARVAHAGETTWLVASLLKVHF
jgi:hypothetical protein